MSKKRSGTNINSRKNVIMSGMKSNPIEILGWYGITAILTAYVLINLGVLQVTSPFYQLLNLTGSFSIILESYNKQAYPSVVLNIIWCIIALFALIKPW